MPSRRPLLVAWATRHQPTQAQREAFPPGTVIRQVWARSPQPRDVWLSIINACDHVAPDVIILIARRVIYSPTVHLIHANAPEAIVVRPVMHWKPSINDYVWTGTWCRVVVIHDASGGKRTQRVAWTPESGIRR